jgi:hypothetical protein
MFKLMKSFYTNDTTYISPQLILSYLDLIWSGLILSYLIVSVAAVRSLAPFALAEVRSTARVQAAARSPVMAPASQASRPQDCPRQASMAEACLAPASLESREAGVPLPQRKGSGQPTPRHSPP